INAYEFINDNSTSITGTLYFWEHWGGGSHLLREYQGGYHLLNLSGATTAATQGSNHPEVGTGGTPIKLPGNYIPVSQGFFVLGDEDGGTINFNNGQRIFHKESSGNSTFVEMNDEFSDSEITPNANNQANNVTTLEDNRLKLRIGFNSINTIRRQLLVTEDSNASSGIDWGFDGMIEETQLDDMFWLINDQKFAIQGTDNIDNQTILPIGVYTDSDGLNSFVLDALTNAPEETSVYLHDKTLNIYHNLSEQNYDIFLPAGEYLERFEITFSNQNTLNITNKVLTDNVDVYYSNNIQSIVIVNPLYKDINALQVMNLLGQSILNIKIVSDQNYQEIRLNELSSGAYIIKLNTSSGIASKKIIVK
ncbi:T9SS type A sorting domain-containing protein, partial [Flavobacteriaceae bacterium]|nr:T9SS type A sorting domain-containing protein [Flavobacteriaceae bacterium]